MKLPSKSTVIYIEEIALFANADAAYAYAGIERETAAPETQAPETDVPETQAPETQAPAADTKAPEQTTEPAGKSGCGSVVGFSAVAVLAAVAAFVARKKD